MRKKQRAPLRRYRHVIMLPFPFFPFFLLILILNTPWPSQARLDADSWGLTRVTRTWRRTWPPHSNLKRIRVYKNAKRRRESQDESADTFLVNDSTTILPSVVPRSDRRQGKGGRSMRDTVHVVSVKTQEIRQRIVRSTPDTGFFFGISPKILKNHPTFSGEPRIKPLAMKEAVTMTLDELRSMRQEMESLRDEIRALKRNMLGETDEADTDRLLAQRRKRQVEFDRIGREVERWAQHLLFEQDGEVDGWKEVQCNKVLQSSLNPDGRTVAYLKWMKDSRGSHANPDDDREYPCIKCFSTIDAPLDIVCQYLSDERKMTEYNDLVVANKEVEEITPHSKICWGQTPAILFIQPRDFLTFCHHRWLKDGTQVLVNQACDSHENFSGKNPQAYALRGANFISPHPDDPSKTRIALLAHASPGPDIPHWASKTAVKALVPIEPFKLFARINQGVLQHRKELEQALPPTEMVSQSGGRSIRPAGMAQMGYACFWPQGGGLQEDQGLLLSPDGPLDSVGDDEQSEHQHDESEASSL